MDGNAVNSNHDDPMTEDVGDTSSTVLDLTSCQLRVYPSSTSPWTSLSGLEELVLRDNKLTKVTDASIFKKLLVFDVSLNEITELYVSKNEVTKIEEIEHLHQLQILELG